MNGNDDDNNNTITITKPIQKGVRPEKTIRRNEALENQATNFTTALRRFPPELPKSFFREHDRKEPLKIFFRAVSSVDQQHSCVRVDRQRKQVIFGGLTSHRGCSSPGRSFRRWDGLTVPTFDGVFVAEDDPLAIVCRAGLPDLIHGVVSGRDGCFISLANHEKTLLIGDDRHPMNYGVIPRAIHWLFQLIAEKKESTSAKFSVRVSAINIRNETEGTHDLLAPSLNLRSPERLKNPQNSINGHSSALHELRAPTLEKVAFYLDKATQGRVGLNYTDTFSSTAVSSIFLFTLHVYQYRVQRCGAGSGVTGGRSRLHFLELMLPDHKLNCPEDRPTIDETETLNINLEIFGTLLSNHENPILEEYPQMNQLRNCINFSNCLITILLDTTTEKSSSRSLSQLLQFVGKLKRSGQPLNNSTNEGRISAQAWSDNSSCDSFAMRRAERMKFRTGSRNCRKSRRKKDKHHCKHTNTHSPDRDVSPSSQQSYATVIFLGQQNGLQSVTKGSDNRRCTNELEILAENADELTEETPRIVNTNKPLKSHRTITTLDQLSHSHTSRGVTKPWPKYSIKKAIETLSTEKEQWVDGPKANFSPQKSKSVGTFRNASLETTRENTEPCESTASVLVSTNQDQRQSPKASVSGGAAVAVSRVNSSARCRCASCDERQTKLTMHQDWQKRSRTLKENIGNAKQPLNIIASDKTDPVKQILVRECMVQEIRDATADSSLKDIVLDSYNLPVEAKINESNRISFEDVQMNSNFARISEWVKSISCETEQVNVPIECSIPYVQSKHHYCDSPLRTMKFRKQKPVGDPLLHRTPDADSYTQCITSANAFHSPVRRRGKSVPPTQPSQGIECLNVHGDFSSKKFNVFDTEPNSICESNPKRCPDGSSDKHVEVKETVQDAFFNHKHTVAMKVRSDFPGLMQSDSNSPKKIPVLQNDIYQITNSQSCSCFYTPLMMRKHHTVKGFDYSSVDTAQKHKLQVATARSASSSSARKLLLAIEEGQNETKTSDHEQSRKREMSLRKSGKGRLQFLKGPLFGKGKFHVHRKHDCVTTKPRTDWSCKASSNGINFGELSNENVTKRVDLLRTPASLSYTRAEETTSSGRGSSTNVSAEIPAAGYLLNPSRYRRILPDATNQSFLNSPKKGQLQHSNSRPKNYHRSDKIIKYSPIRNSPKEISIKTEPGVSIYIPIDKLSDDPGQVDTGQPLLYNFTVDRPRKPGGHTSSGYESIVRDGELSSRTDSTSSSSIYGQALISRPIATAQRVHVSEEQINSSNPTVCCSQQEHTHSAVSLQSNKNRLLGEDGGKEQTMLSAARAVNNESEKLEKFSGDIGNTMSASSSSSTSRRSRSAPTRSEDTSEETTSSPVSVRYVPPKDRIANTQSLNSSTENNETQKYNDVSDDHSVEINEMLTQIRYEKIRDLLSQQVSLKRELLRTKEHLLAEPNTWSFGLHVAQQLHPDSEGYLEALQKETDKLRTRVDSCKARLLLVTTFACNQAPNDKDGTT